MKLQQLVQQFIALHLQFQPVNATFMGLDGHDHELPPADGAAAERELVALQALEQQASVLPAGSTAAERIETTMLLGQLRMAIRELQARPKYHNPSWYTSEAAFGLISLLLPAAVERDSGALQQRIEAIPRFLLQGQERLAGQPVPVDWRTRAEREGQALIRLLEQGLPLHPLFNGELEAAAAAAVPAIRSFLDALPAHGDADPAAGREYLEFLMREVHQLPFSSEEAERLAQDGYNRALAELEACALELDRQRTWQQQLADRELDHPDLSGIIPAYQRLHIQAMDAANDANLVTPAFGYDLDFELLPAWAQPVAADLYFLFYRSPAAGHPGTGSTYWVFPPGPDMQAYLQSQNASTIKITHAVHHGSIGHHTQNARARSAPVQLGRIAGTDCASGIALLSGGTLIEGWACYTQDLLLEADGFYEPAEKLVLKHAELRNAAMCLADIRLHSGTWSLQQMRDFYVNEIGLPPARAWTETTRNSIFPGTRLMYWLGTRAIKEARATLAGADARVFHDTLLSYGAVPVHSVIREISASLKMKEENHA